MPTIQLRVADCSKKTAQWLADQLKEAGIKVVYGADIEPDATVCYGYGFKAARKRTLNCRAGVLSNYEQMRVLRDNGIQTVPMIDDIKRADWSRITFPLLARAERHDGGGHDIMPVFQEEEIPWRIAAGAKFFTQYIPRAAEYRLWIYRRRLQAAYSKEMTEPKKYVKIGCNYEDGFEHVYTEKSAIPANIVEMAARSVFSLGLDFGGVDILVGKNKVPYVLEVNTASGANGPKAVGLTHLAKSIIKWVEAGYPEQAKEYKNVE